MRVEREVQSVLVHGANLGKHGTDQMHGVRDNNNRRELSLLGIFHQRFGFSAGVVGWRDGADRSRRDSGALHKRRAPVPNAEAADFIVLMGVEDKHPWPRAMIALAGEGDELIMQIAPGVDKDCFGAWIPMLEHKIGKGSPLARFKHFLIVAPLPLHIYY